MDHRVTDDQGRVVYYPSLAEAIAAAKALTGRRLVESCDRRGTWWCVETLYSDAPFPDDPDDFFDGLDRTLATHPPETIP
jgi:hypothetical protein